MARNHQRLAAEAIHYMDLLLEISSDETTSHSFVVLTDEDGVDNGDIEQYNLHHSLADWQIRHRVPHVYCDALLKILNVYHPELPLSTRTLIGTIVEKRWMSFLCFKGHTSTSELKLACFNCSAF